MSAARWVIDISAPNLDGLFGDQDGIQKADNPRFIREQVANREIVLMRRNQSGILEPVNIAGGSLAAAIGAIDKAPTSGTFSLSFDGDDTGLTGLAYNISAADLETALNSNPNVSGGGGGGGVTVTKIGTVFFVRFGNPGFQPLFQYDAEGLQPQSYIHIVKSPDPDLSENEVQEIQLLQLPYASTPASGWTNTATGEVDVTAGQTGTIGTKASWFVDFSSKPIGGSVLIEWETPAIWKLTATKTNDYVAETRALKFPTGGAMTDFAGKYFDIFLANGDTRRVWFNLDGGSTEPPHPSGVTNIEVNYVTADDLGDLIQATVDAMATDTTAFASVANSGNTPSGIEVPSGYRTGLIYTLDDAGKVGLPEFNDTGIVSSATAGEVGLGVKAGTDGIGGATVKINSPAGKFAFYATSGTTLEPVVSVDDCLDSVAIAVAEGDDSNEIADLFQAAIEAYAGFSATSTGNVVTITPDDVGPLDAPTVTGLGFLFASTSQLGHSVSAEIPVTSSASDIEEAMGNEVTAVVASDTRWIITSATTGPQGDITADGESVQFAGTFTGELALNTIALDQAFAATTATKIDATLEIEFTPSGGSPDTILQIGVQLFRDLIRGQLVTTPAFETALTDASGVAINFSITGLTGGGSDKLDGITTTGLTVPRMVCTPLISGGPLLWLLRSGTDAEASPGIIRPDDYASSTNEKVWQSVL